MEVCYNKVLSNRYLILLIPFFLFSLETHLTQMTTQVSFMYKWLQPDLVGHKVPTFFIGPGSLFATKSGYLSSFEQRGL